MIWDGEWRENLLRAALDRVKRHVNPAHYEMYHLHLVQGLSPRDTARALGVSAAAVHLAKHRVGRLVKTELKRLTVAESSLGANTGATAVRSVKEEKERSEDPL